MVQINVELIQPTGEKPRINIVDVLKPAEEEVEIAVDTDVHRGMVYLKTEVVLNVLK